MGEIILWCQHEPWLPGATGLCFFPVGTELCNKLCSYHHFGY